MYSSLTADHLRVAVKHRGPAPNRYTWEIIRDQEILPMEEARATGSVRGKRQVNLERMRLKDYRQSNSDRGM
jgi:hypothetical protein